MRYNPTPHRQPYGVTRRGFLVAAGGFLFSTRIVNDAWAASDVIVQAPTDGTDATGVIQAQIDSAPDGVAGTPTVVRFPVGRSQGRYRVDGQVAINQRRHLVIAGPSPDDPAVIWTDRTGIDMSIVDRNGNSIRSHWKIAGSADVALRNLAVQGPNVSRDEKGDANYVGGLVFEHGFSISGGSSGITLDNCSTESVHGDGAYVGGASSNIRISSTSLNFCGRQGIAITNAEGVLIDGCNLRGIRRSAFDLEPNGASWTVRNVEIRNCVIDTRLVAFTASGQSEVSHVWIHHNTVERSAGSWPMVVVKRGDGGRGRDWRVEDNTRAHPTNPYYMMSFTGVDGVTVRRNTARAKSTHAKAIAAVELRNCGQLIEVSDNDFSWSPDLLLVAGVDTAVEHCDNRWGPDGSLTEDVCENGFVEAPVQQTPDTVSAPAETVSPATAAAIQPEATTTSTVVEPDTPAPQPPQTPAATKGDGAESLPQAAPPSTPPSTPVSVPPTTTVITTPAQQHRVIGATAPFDAGVPTGGEVSLVSPTTTATTAVLTGLVALFAVVIRRRQRFSPLVANFAPAVDHFQDIGPQSSSAEYHSPAPKATGSTTRAEPHPYAVRGYNPGIAAGMPARGSGAQTPGRSRVESDSFRFAKEYQLMSKDSPQDPTANSEDQEP